jgi:hypothetical protein
MTAEETLRVALWHMVDKFKPFTMKPIGAPGSMARAEQDQQIAAYKRAVEALSLTPAQPHASENTEDRQ